MDIMPFDRIRIAFLDDFVMLSASFLASGVLRGMFRIRGYP